MKPVFTFVALAVLICVLAVFISDNAALTAGLLFMACVCFFVAYLALKDAPLHKEED